MLEMGDKQDISPSTIKFNQDESAINFENHPIHILGSQNKIHEDPMRVTEDYIAMKKQFHLVNQVQQQKRVTNVS
jgi:hypothetical protein